VSLYVRLFNSFWNHRKTLRLKASIGDAAYWVMPRLWSYAAENVPSGCFKDFTAGEIACSIGYTGNATELLEALLRAEWLDRDTMQLHDWDEHNKYHVTYAERASKAAKAKWDKERILKEESTRKEKKGVCIPTSSASSSASSIRLHGIPATVEDVIAYGQTLYPPVDEARCRKFFSYYEGQARQNANGETFWVTSGESVITNWKAKLPTFADNKRSISGGNTTSTAKRDTITGRILND
jgi:hypothetical protein